MNIKEKIIFILIGLLALFLRVYNLSNNPPGLNSDEADIGYTAYSLLKTGRDWYGDYLPSHFKAFSENDRSPLYTYAVIPSIALFGLNTFSFRLPAVVFGFITCLLTYFLAKFITNSKKISYISFLLIVINPWHIHISRTGMEISLSVLLVTYAIFLMLKSSENRKYLLLSSFFFALSLHSYNAPKIFVPLFILATLIIYKKMFLNQGKIIIISFFILSISFLFLMKNEFYDQKTTRIQRYDMLSFQTSKQFVERERHLTVLPLGILNSLMHNKAQVMIERFRNNYFNAFSVNFWFINGEGNLVHSVVDRGEFFIFELIFIAIGIYLLATKRNTWNKLLIIWIIIAPIPASLVGQLYVYRMSIIIPPVILLSAMGAVWIWEKLKLHKIYLLLFSFLFIIIFLEYQLHYHLDYPVYSQKWWETEKITAIKYSLQNEDKFNRIYLKGGRSWFLYLGIYSRIDPKTIQAFIKCCKDNNIWHIGKYYVSDISYTEKKKFSEIFPAKTLYIGEESDFPLDKPIKTIIDNDTWGVIYKIIGS